MMKLRIRSADLARANHKIRLLANPTQLLQRIGTTVVAQTQLKIERGINPPNAPLTQLLKSSNKTLRDTGSLMNSITHTVHGAVVEIGSPLPYAARVHEGGTFTPEKTKYIWIPATRRVAQITRRHGETAAINAYKRAGYYCFMSKSKKAFLAVQKGKKKNITILFVLKKSITIPARQYLKQTPRDVQILNAQLMEHMRKVLA